MFAMEAQDHHRGCRARKVHSHAIDAFASINAPLIGTVVDGRIVRASCSAAARRAKRCSWPRRSTATSFCQADAEPVAARRWRGSSRARRRGAGRHGRRPYPDRSAARGRSNSASRSSSARRPSMAARSLAPTTSTAYPGHSQRHPRRRHEQRHRAGQADVGARAGRRRQGDHADRHRRRDRVTHRDLPRPRDEAVSCRHPAPTSCDARRACRAARGRATSSRPRIRR